MTSDERGYLTDTLVILIFVYLSGAATGIVGTAYWNRHTSSREEPAEPEAPEPELIVRKERVEVVVPPLSVRVGTTKDCYAYHDVDNPANRCNAMTDIVRRHPGAKVTKRFYPCEVCFPGGAYIDSDRETHFAPDGHPRGVRPRRIRDNVPLQVFD